MEPTGERYLIEAAGYTASCVEAGGALTSLRHDDRPVLAETPPGEVVSGGRGQILMPWPNRLRDGSYRFGGRDQQLPISEPGTHNASHGLVRWCSWRPLDRRPDAVTLGCRLMAQRGYPWTLDLTVGYSLGDAGLTVTLTATNRSDGIAPFAAGMHPYLDVGAGLDECRLTLPAAGHLQVDDRMLPITLEPVDRAHDFRAGAALRGVRLDDGFTHLVRGDDGRAVVRLEGPEATVEMWLDDSWRWLQVYSADGVAALSRAALAVEPMTSPADAFNSGTDLLTLESDETWTGTYGVRAV